MTRRSAIAIGPALSKTLVFVTATSFVLALVALQLGHVRFYHSNSYKAEFTDGSSLLGGDPVLLAGVKVGAVSGVTVTKDAHALVDFEVKKAVDVREGSKALVRYRNLTGDRYLELVPGPEDGALLAPGGMIPLADTRPALDLDVLVGGLKPLFQGLDPKQINTFSQEIVAVLQGQGGTIESILERVASLGRTVKEKDQVIGQTIDNLNSVLGNLDSHSVALSQTVSGLQQVASGLAADRKRLGNSFSSVEKLITSVDLLLRKLRSPFAGTIKELGRTATQANAGIGTINEILRMLPGVYLRIGRLGSRGSGYNLYICSLRIRMDGPDGKPIYTPWIGPDPNVQRCKPGVAPLETPQERTAKEHASAARSVG